MPYYIPKFYLKYYIFNGLFRQTKNLVIQLFQIKRAFLRIIRSLLQLIRLKRKKKYFALTISVQNMTFFFSQEF